MPDPRHCLICGAELPSDAPEGPCSRCQAGKDPAATISAAPAGDGLGTATYLAPANAPTPGELAAHFPQLEILQLQGRGGMGAVYLARQPALDRRVALKILPPLAGRDPAFAERFAREARALARLNHPSIVSLYDFGQSDGIYYFLMEFVEGGNLRQAFRAGRIQPAESLRLASRICEALQYAHDEGIVHRDIKPENLLLDNKGRVKIADFGLAKVVGAAPAGLALTGSQQVMGTLHYMAPEQLERPLEIDHRADVYSLGVVLYEMLTGELPLGRFVPPSQKSPVDLRVDAIVLRALEKDPARRYASAGEMKTDLEKLTDARPVPTGDASQATATVSVVGEPSPRRLLPHLVGQVRARLGRKRVLWLTVLGLVLGGLVLGYWRWANPKTLCNAAAKGDLATVRLLVASNLVHVNARDDHGWTPLLQGAWAGHEPVVEYLLSQNASVDGKGKAGETALMMAAFQGHAAIVQRLLEKRADVNAQSNDGQTALIRAAANGHTSLVQTLLSKGAILDARENAGSTSLFFAAGNGQTDVIRVLLARGAQVHVANDHGETPLSKAVELGHEAVVELLLANGAEDDGLLALRGGFAKALAQRYAEAIPLFLKFGERRKEFWERRREDFRERQNANRATRPVLFRLNGWQYEIPAPAPSVAAFLGECYQRTSQPDLAKQAFTSCLASWPAQVGTLALYRRKIRAATIVTETTTWQTNNPNQTCAIEYGLMPGGVQAVVQNPQQHLGLSRKLEKVSGGETYTESGGVSGVFH